MENGDSSSDYTPPYLPPTDEIAFFDVETTIPKRVGQGHCLLEFGAILVCKRRLVEVGSYSTLIKPDDLSLISTASVRCNGITREAVSVAPSFSEVADSVYNILHGRVWAGHNILRFDCPRIREAFLKIGKSPPEPKGTIDSLPLLTQKFGRRAGNMKMATLAAYFGLGKQSHRSLDDVRMNLEVLKYCATVLFLESTASELSHADNTDVSPSLPNPNLNSMSDSSFVDQDRVISVMDSTRNGNWDFGQSNNLAADMDTSLTPLIDKMAITFREATEDRDENFKPNIPEMLPSSSRTVQHRYGTSPDYLDPSIVLKSNIKATILSANQHGCRMSLLYGEVPLQLCCIGLKVHFGISTKFVDHTGKPKLSVTLGASESLCQVLDACENVAQRSLNGFGSTSDWRPLIKKNSFFGSSTARLNIPTSVNRDVTTCLAEIYQKESSGNAKKLDLSESSADELKSLFVPGRVLDAYFCMDVYDYQQYSGIRLVAKRLVFHPI